MSLFDNKEIETFLKKPITNITTVSTGD